MNQKQKKIAIILLVVVLVAVVVIIFIKRKSAASGVGSGATQTATNPEKEWLINTFKATNQGNEDAMLAAIPKMTDGDIHLLYLRALSQIPGQDAAYQQAMAVKDQIVAMMNKYGLAGL